MSLSHAALLLYRWGTHEQGLQSAWKVSVLWMAVHVHSSPPPIENTIFRVVARKLESSCLNRTKCAQTQLCFNFCHHSDIYKEISNRLKPHLLSRVPPIPEYHTQMLTRENSVSNMARWNERVTTSTGRVINKQFNGANESTEGRGAEAKVQNRKFPFLK